MEGRQNSSFNSNPGSINRQAVLCPLLFAACHSSFNSNPGSINRQACLRRNTTGSIPGVSIPILVRLIVKPLVLVGLIDLIMVFVSIPILVRLIVKPAETIIAFLRARVSIPILVRLIVKPFIVAELGSTFAVSIPILVRLIVKPQRS